MLTVDLIIGVISGVIVQTNVTLERLRSPDKYCYVML